MNALSKEELTTLMQRRNDWCVSMFMPTFRTGVESQQNSIRLRNIVRQAEDGLANSGLRTQEVKELLEPVQELVNNILFWRNQSDGLALFVSKDEFHYFCLPFSFDELLVITDRFHMKPLLPLLHGDERFYVLALSQNKTILYEGTSQAIKEMSVDTLPNSLAEALQTDNPERQVKFRSGKGVGQGGMMSGHGADIEDVKGNLLQYFQRIDKGLHDLLKEGNIPLILAGVEYQFPIYREANSYPFLMEEGIAGNPKGASPEQLHRDAWAIVKPYLQKAENEALSQYNQSLGTGLTSDVVQEIIPAAYHGRVGILFVAPGYQYWGIYNPGDDTVLLDEKQEPGNEDLADFAAIQTFMNGGTVFVVAPDLLPGGARMAALFRY
ncbi:hypothetical protein SAMN04489760_1194 [Syntrophus gentianae]|uniref:Uncharacterized protein n=1 Tax=Syntrophus gentianae TaxID=43775 RepID=A0A1H7YZX2_9BACT|nr:hypothetical protein [Syntrophus gentianae]SEM50888.1 hypothetical protein SAMN04489760_1194 [Syntrophus gentianae]